MRIAVPPNLNQPGFPLWPPLLATRGEGSLSSEHAHHALHLVLAVEGELRVKTGGRWVRAAGVLTAPDQTHAIDAKGVKILLCFLDPESEAGRALVPLVGDGVRVLSATERDAIAAGFDPMAIMGAGGAEWIRGVVTTLGGSPRSARTVHPRVKKLLRALRELPPDADLSLERLARDVSLSPGRLMHAFTESIGIPLRPYLAWVRLQRAASAIVTGTPLSQAALDSGFSDSAHMSRAFRSMLGLPPSALRPRKAAS
ncbi:MAG: helix-turn-helix domain-containing protein [Myxococcaceae bacterium]